MHAFQNILAAYRHVANRVKVLPARFSLVSLAPAPEQKNQ
jgi:hypothetical protein